MAKAFQGQYDDEEVLYFFRKHPVVMRKGLIISMLALLACTFPSLIVPKMSYFYGGLVAGLILSILFFMPSWIHWYFSVYIVTNQRFIQSTQKGFFHKKVIDIALNQIQMVNYEVSGIQETLLGFGTMNIQTYVGDLVIHDVHKPSHVQHEILTILRSRGIAIHNNERNDSESDNE